MESDPLSLFIHKILKYTALTDSVIFVGLLLLHRLKRSMQAAFLLQQKAMSSCNLHESENYASGGMTLNKHVNSKNSASLGTDDTSAIGGGERPSEVDSLISSLSSATESEMFVTALNVAMKGPTGLDNSFTIKVCIYHFFIFLCFFASFALHPSSDNRRLFCYLFMAGGDGRVLT
jgi:hypothetical protein